MGVVNAGFGFGVYALLVFFRLNPFAAQIISHLAGMAFNYFMFRRHVFKGSRAAVAPYIGAYAFNYALSLAVLAGLKTFVVSDYLAGLATIVIVAAANFVVLKYLVFLPEKVGRR